jgi:hypothetical protein
MYYAMKRYWGSRGIAPRILDPGTKWRWVVRFTPRPLYPQGKSPRYPLDRRWVGPRTVLDAVAKRKIPSPRRESNSRTPIVQSVAQRYNDWVITDGGEWSVSRPGRFIPTERAPGTLWIGGWVVTRAGLDAVAKRKSPSFAPAGNRTPVFDPVA